MAAAPGAPEAELWDAVTDVAVAVHAEAVEHERHLRVITECEELGELRAALATMRGAERTFAVTEQEGKDLLIALQQAPAAMHSRAWE